MAKLLIVEDDLVLLNGLEKLLSIQGHDVWSATTGREASEMLRTADTEAELPELIIADFIMPEMNGLELLEIVRADQRLQNTPFLFITAQNAEKMEGSITPSDRTFVLYKPFDRQTLEDTIAHVLEYFN